MTQPVLIAYLGGMLSVACLAIGLVFLKFWRVSRDSFFICFAAAFAMFAVGGAIRTFVVSSEHAHLVFLPRLCGFLLILAAILIKNRRER